GTPPASQAQFAIKYVRMLAAAKLAEDRKLEDNPVVAAELQKKVGPGRADVLAKAFYQQMGEAAANATDSELRQYYAEHPSEFEEVEVLQLSLPTSGYSRKGMRLDRAMLKPRLTVCTAERLAATISTSCRCRPTPIWASHNRPHRRG